MWSDWLHGKATLLFTAPGRLWWIVALAAVVIIAAVAAGRRSGRIYLATVLRIAALALLGASLAGLSLETQEELKKTLPNARIVTMPGLGHYPSDEKPKEFLAIVDEALVYVREVHLVHYKEEYRPTPAERQELEKSYRDLFPELAPLS